MTRSPNLRFELEKAWRLVTAPLRPLPSFVLPGAPKCGTSTLYDYIVAHPRVRRGARKEPTNFVHYPGSGLRAAMNYPLRVGAGDFVVGDASVEYFTHPDAPRNVRAIIPEARLVFVFREPVRRAWSDYQMFRRAGQDSEDFPSTVRSAMRWLDDPALHPLIDAAARHAWHPARYVLCGWYARALERWWTTFPRDQCLVLFSEDFFADPAATTRAVWRHLGLPDAPVPTLPVAREGGYAETMPEETQQALRAFFEPRNAELARLLGRSLPWT